MASLADFFALPTVQDQPIATTLSQPTIKSRIDALEEQVAMIQRYLEEMVVNDVNRDQYLRTLTECSDELCALRLARDEAPVQLSPISSNKETRTTLPIASERPVDLSANWGSHMWRD